MQPISYVRKRFAFLCQSMHSRRFRALFDCVEGTIRGQKLTLTGIGRNLSSKVNAKHKIKKVDRLLCNKDLTRERHLIYRACISLLAIANLRPKVLVDWSGLTHCGEYFMLRAAIPVAGRAITIYEEAHHLRHYDNPKTNKGFLLTLKSLLPAKCRPIIVTDAGFKNPWFIAVKSLGWDFVGRVRGKTKARFLGKRWIFISSLHNQALFIAKYFGEIELAKSNPLRCHLYAIKYKKRHRVHQNLRGHRVRCSSSLKHAKREREPWLIVSSLPNRPANSAKKVIAIYKTRMQIEESFRDTKNQRNGLALRETRSRTKDRLNILLMIGTIASLILTLVGKIGVKYNMQYGYQSNSIKNKRVLSYFFLGQEIIRDGPLCNKISYSEITHALEQLVAIEPAIHC